MALPTNPSFLPRWGLTVIRAHRDSRCEVGETFVGAGDSGVSRSSAPASGWAIDFDAPGSFLSFGPYSGHSRGSDVRKDRQILVLETTSDQVEHVSRRSIHPIGSFAKVMLKPVRHVGVSDQPPSILLSWWRKIAGAAAARRVFRQNHGSQGA